MRFALQTFLLALAAAVFSTPVAAAIYEYSPGLGSLPEGQGFTRVETTGAVAPTVGGGVFHTFAHTDTTNGTQWWQQNSAALNFTTTAYVLEADLHVISSTYTPNIGTGQRSGYYLQAIDSFGRIFAVGIASGGITINTDSAFHPTNGVPFTPFNTTDGFHSYRLVIDGGMGSLFIDNNFFASTPLGGSAFLIPPNNAPNRVLFGDAGGVGGSEVELRLFRFDTLNEVPEPTSLCLMLGGLGLAAVGLRRRRSSAVS